MSLWQGLLVFVAGIWAGTINTVVGSGTLITFPVLIGCDDNGTLQEHYQGMLDELRVYKRALTEAEIQNLP